VLTIRGLVRYVIFFVMKLKTRTVEIAGITSEPSPRRTARLNKRVTLRATSGGPSRKLSAVSDQRSAFQ
jgi:hypothetical protein